MIVQQVFGLVELLAGHGVRAQGWHPGREGGWRVRAWPPGREEPVVLWDATDVNYLLAELAYERGERPRRPGDRWDRAA